MPTQVDGAGAASGTCLGPKGSHLVLVFGELCLVAIAHLCFSPHMALEVLRPRMDEN